ncbi:PAS domain S-box protein [bacterium]|nr:MAG: PAS domain S-box protein [bacterium]
MKKNDTHNNTPDFARPADLTDAENERRAMLYLLEDLEETTEAVSKGKKEWEATFDAIPDAILIHDRDFKIIRCNSAYGRAAGMDFNDMMGKLYYDVFPKTGTPFKMCATLETEKTISDEQKRWSEEMAYQNKFYRVTGFPLAINSDNVNYVHIIEDITEKKAEETALKESEYRYKTLYDNLNDAAFLAESDTGLIIESNKPAEILLGRPVQEIIGMHFSQLHPAEKTAEYEKHFATHVKKGRGADYEGEVIRKDGKLVPVFISAHPLVIGDKRLIFGIFRDLTFQKESEEKIANEAALTKHLLMIANATASTTDTEKLMGQVVACVKQILKCDCVLSYLWDDEAAIFRPCRAEGISHAQISFFMTELVKSAALMVKKAVDNNGIGEIKLETGSEEEPLGGHYNWLEDAGTLAVLPIAGRDGYLGLIVCVCGRTNPKAKTDIAQRDKELLRGIGQQISVSLEEARLYKKALDKTMELSHKVETIQVMNNIDRNILSSLEPQEILETVVRLIPQVVACDRTAVNIADRKKGGWFVKAGFGLASYKVGDFIPFSETTLTNILNTGRTEYIANLKEAGASLPLEKRILSDGFLTLLRIPFVVKGEVTGVLHAGARRASAFTPDDLSTLKNLSAQIGVALEHTKTLKDLEDLFIGTVRALSNAIDAKSPWTMGHSERVTSYALKIAKTIGLEDERLKRLEIAGLLHDVGKLGTYETILNKPGRLTDEELAIMQQHPAQGAAILAPIKQLEDIIPGVKYHHEFYDGNGYPEKLKGDDIPLMARILKVADTVDAMAADRPYRKGRSFDAIIAELKKFSGIQFDPSIVEAFLKTTNGLQPTDNAGPV